MTDNLSEYNWSLSFEICEKFLDNNIEVSEANSRLIMNRSYYSIYGKISQHLKTNGIYEHKGLTGKNSGHKDLIETLYEMTDSNYSKLYCEDKTKRKRYKRIHKSLKRLLELRVGADYNFSCIENHFLEAQESAILGKFVLNLISYIDKNLVYDHNLETDPYNSI